MSQTLTPLVGSGRVGDFVHEHQEMAKEQGFRNVSKIWYDTTMSYDEGLEKLEVGYAATEDIMLTVKEMIPSVDVDGKFVMRNRVTDEPYVPTGHALTQIATWAKCGTWLPQQLTANEERKNDLQDAETLVKIIDNGFRFIKPDKKFLFRTRKDGSLRAMLSDKYAILDNRWFLDCLRLIIPTGRLSHWDKCDGADTIYGNILIPDSLRVEKDSEYGGGVSVGNSEIGVRCESSCPWLFRAICCNGNIWDKTPGVFYKRVHRGKKIDLKAEFQLLKDNITKQIPLVDAKIDGLLSLRSLSMTADKKAYMAAVAQELGYNVSNANKLAGAYEVEPESNAFGLVNAVTRAGQQMSPELWLDSDSFGGTLIDGQEKAWDKLSWKANSLKIEEIDKVFGLDS